MAKAKVTDRFNAPIDKVWDLIKDFGDLSAWAPGGNVTKLEEEGVGMVRHVEGEGGKFVERCEAHDDENHTFSYSLIESPAPFKDYLAKVKLNETGPDSCEIEWSSDFQPVDIAEKEIVQGVEGTYGFFIDNIKNALKVGNA